MTVQIAPDLVRSLILEMSHNAGANGAHVGSALSCVEIIASLYSDFELLSDIDQDTFILSKGHAALCQYAVMAEHGVFSKNEVLDFNKNGSGLFCHSKYSKEKYLSFSGGSLGLGLSFSAGLAICRKANKLPGSIICLIGDGELDEGICWEAFNLLGHQRMDNILVIVDNNNMQSDGLKDDVINSGALFKKIDGFGLKSIQCNGHSIEELRLAYKKFREKKINVIIADTIKGYGVPLMENNPDWHYGIVSDKVLARINSDE